MSLNHFHAAQRYELIAPAAGKHLKLVWHEPALLKKFQLEELGVDTEELVHHLNPTFDTLPADTYHRKLRQIQFLKKALPCYCERLDALLADYYKHDEALASVQDLLDKLSPSVKKEFCQIECQRCRKIAKFKVHLTAPGVMIERVEAGAFRQTNVPANHPLALPRHFEEASKSLTEDPGIKKILQYIAKEIGSAADLEIVLHQVMMHTSIGDPFTLPDGIHQDGADFIISAIPLILENVKIPVSTVYDLNKFPVTTAQLHVGEGLLHDDHLWWHSVSDLYTTSTEGRRGTLGFDVKIME